MVANSTLYFATANALVALVDDGDRGRLAWSVSLEALAGGPAALNSLALDPTGASLWLTLRRAASGAALARTAVKVGVAAGAVERAFVASGGREAAAGRALLVVEGMFGGGGDAAATTAPAGTDIALLVSSGGSGRDGALLGLRDGAAPEGVAVVFDVSLGATAAGAAAGAGVQIVPLGDALVVTRGGTAISVGVA